MKEFVKDHFDKLMLAGMIVYLIHVVLALVYFQAPAETVAWARELTSGFTGALIGLITGVAVGKRLAAKEAARDNKENS